MALSKDKILETIETRQARRRRPLPLFSFAQTLKKRNQHEGKRVIIQQGGKSVVFFECDIPLEYKGHKEYVDDAS